MLSKFITFMQHLTVTITYVPQGEIGQDPFRPKRITYIPATTLELYLGDRDQTTVIWLGT